MLGQTGTTDYLALARSLGSDVPFFLAQAPALVEGAGERVTALGSPPPWHAVVVRPPVAVSTAWAYARLDENERPSRARNASVSLQLGEALQRREFDAVVELMQNDFHDVIAAQHPEIRTALDALHAAEAPRAMLTGSGSCVFTLARDEAQRSQIARQLRLPDGYTKYECSFFDGHAWRSAA
jgi:4-diphosphocytidyl-2-C-methyl-D-erythritol kinase